MRAKMLYFPANLGREKFSKKRARKESGSMNPGVIFAQKASPKASPKASEEAQKAFERDMDLLDRERDVDSGMAALEEAVNIFPDYKEDYFEQSLTKVRTVLDKGLHIGRH
jgi:hypothetical protein